MKTFKKFLGLAVIFSAVTFNYSCTKESSVTPTAGEQGPAGEKGAKGDTGAAGAAGAAGAVGAKGDPGTANVIYSEWFGPGFKGGSVWVGATDQGRLVNTVTKSAPGITATVIDQGVVLVFAQLKGYASTYGFNVNSTALLPVNGTYLSGGLQVETWSSELNPAQLKIHFQNSTNRWSTAAMSTDYRFRYVIIPGGAVGGRLKSNNLDLSDYEAVKKYYNMPE